MKYGDLYDLDEKQLLARLENANPDGTLARAVQAEFQRRHVVAARKAAEAQEAAANEATRAAQAAVDAAVASQKTAFWTRVSAFAIAASVLVMAIATAVDVAR